MDKESLRDFLGRPVTQAEEPMPVKAVRRRRGQANKPRRATKTIEASGQNPRRGRRPRVPVSITENELLSMGLISSDGGSDAPESPPAKRTEVGTAANGKLSADVNHERIVLNIKATNNQPLQMFESDGTPMHDLAQSLVTREAYQVYRQDYPRRVSFTREEYNSVLDGATEIATSVHGLDKDVVGKMAREACEKSRKTIECIEQRWQTADCMFFLDQVTRPLADEPRKPMKFNHRTAGYHKDQIHDILMRTVFLLGTFSDLTLEKMPPLPPLSFENSSDEFVDE